MHKISQNQARHFITHRYEWKCNNPSEFGFYVLIFLILEVLQSFPVQKCVILKFRSNVQLKNMHPSCIALVYDAVSDSVWTFFFLIFYCSTFVFSHFLNCVSVTVRLDALMLLLVFAPSKHIQLACTCSSNDHILIHTEYLKSMVYVIAKWDFS